MLRSAWLGEMWTSRALLRVEDLRFSESVDLADLAERRDRRRSKDFVRSSELRIVSTVKESRLLGKTVSAAFKSSSESSSEAGATSGGFSVSGVVCFGVSGTMPLAAAKFSTKEGIGSGRSASATACEMLGATRLEVRPDCGLEMAARDVEEAVEGNDWFTKAMGDTGATGIDGLEAAAADRSGVEDDLLKRRLGFKDEPILRKVEKDDAEVLDLTDCASSSTLDLRDLRFFSTVTDEKPSNVGGSEARASFATVLVEELLCILGGTTADCIVLDLWERGGITDAPMVFAR